jgi:hypothetical protein
VATVEADGPEEAVAKFEKEDVLNSHQPDITHRQFDLYGHKPDNHAAPLAIVHLEDTDPPVTPGAPP